MRTPTWKPQVLTTIEGVTYTLHFEEEFMDARRHFVEDCGWSAEEYNAIKKGYWFTAKIEATKGDEVLSDSYLGGNCYKSLKDVMAYEGDTTLGSVLSGYAPQMVEECKEGAHIALGLLIQRQEERLLILKN